MNELPLKTFPGKRSHEVIKLIVRKHWVIYVFAVFKAFFLIIVPLGVVTAIYLSITNTTVKSMIITGSLIYLLFAYLIIFISWLNEELDTIIITSERIINIDQRHFLDRTIAESSLSQLSDVRAFQKGIFSDLMRYRSIELQSATNQVLARIEYVGRPFTIAEKITAIRNDFFIKHSSVHEFKDENTSPPDRNTISSFHNA